MNTYRIVARLVFFSILLVIALPSCLTPAQQPVKEKETAGMITEQPFTPTFTESQQATHKIPEGQVYTFGYLEVLENRSKPTGNTVKMPVYIFKSRSATPKPDPVIYTVGGPGYSSMPSSSYMEYYQYLNDRDFILFEQRGNYYAEPHLDCPEWAKALYLSNLPDSDDRLADSLFVDAAKSCRERLTAKGIDLNGYNTNEIAADIVDLKTVLGIDSFNLLTISYSTKIAQVLLRDYPEGIRSVVMDSPLPLAVSYDEESVGNFLEVVEQFLAGCAADDDCNQAYPNLKERFFAYLREKTQSPLVVTIEHPEDRTPETFKLSGRDLITVFTSASTNEVADIPYEINKLLTGDLSSLKAQLADLFEPPGNGAGVGMRLSVWCAEEFPFNDQAVIKRESFRYPEVTGLSPDVYDAAVCNIWSVSPATARDNEAVTSEVPVLLTSGEYDSDTPPKWAVEMRNQFKNHHHLIFKGWKHTVTTNWSNQCAMEAANAFFNHPYRDPTPDCFEGITAPKFRVE